MLAILPQVGYHWLDLIFLTKDYSLFALDDSLVGLLRSNAMLTPSHYCEGGINP